MAASSSSPASDRGEDAAAQGHPFPGFGFGNLQGPEFKHVLVGNDEWVKLGWACRDSEDERVRQAFEQAVKSAVQK